MRRFTVLIAMVLLVASIVFLVYLLFNPQPIQIVLETGQEITTKSPDYFTITTAMILITCSFIIGASIMYLYYNADAATVITRHTASEHKVEGHTPGAYDLIIPLLRDDEKKAVHIIKEHHGEMLQNELVLKLGISKVKTTRILASLERKQVITKHRHGMTNSIKLKHV